MNKFNSVWFLILTILLLYLLIGGKGRLSAAWQGLTGGMVSK